MPVVRPAQLLGSLSRTGTHLIATRVFQFWMAVTGGTMFHLCLFPHAFSRFLLEPPVMGFNDGVMEGLSSEAIESRAASEARNVS